MKDVRCRAALLSCWFIASACTTSSTSTPPPAATQEASLGPASSHAPRTVTTPPPAPAIVERYGKVESAGPVRESVMVMRDASGKIGGYVYSSGIMDSPVAYLSPEGKQVAMFHIFGSDEEKQRDTPIIEALRQAYPEQTALECPKR